MKYLVVIANGLTDKPIAEKENKTPLQTCGHTQP